MENIQIRQAEKTKLYEDCGYQKSGQSYHGGWYMLKVLESK
ncbi:MAG: hypothetical protein OXR68_03800 [Alphaproteobacteria bacterium]|nr:hypothetical protein [Alphaproteobacteria bacterium]MDD9919729.1 hypothetical protein [Alphaproteobacteria bacterium]